MALINRITLDVLKPHQPNLVDFASQLADLGPGYEVNIQVQEVDDNTQTVILSMAADSLDFGAIIQQIETMGGSVHSIDEVDVAAESAGSSV